MATNSELFSKRTLEYMRELIPQNFPAIGVTDAQHHVFLDQPERFVAALAADARDAARRLNSERPTIKGRSADGGQYAGRTAVPLRWAVGTS